MFLTEGTPGSLLTAEIGNWTGHVVAAPRSELAALLAREEAGRTGIYVLLGDDPDGDGALAYIGEGDEVGTRLRRHAAPESKNGKDFWDRVVIVTSKDTNLTKAHARYLESRLIALALRAGRARLTNNTAPPTPQLPEADVSDMENFIAEVRIVLPVLGVNLLRSVSATTVSAIPGVAETENAAVSPVFEMTVKKHGISATAQEIDGEFVVRAGSQVRSAWIGAGDSYRRLREELEREGVLASADGRQTVVFTRDYPFASPSAAAAIVAGRPANGRIEWRTQDGRTFGGWQSRGVATPEDDEQLV
ncbi:GIY-YIG nuclease family protein [Nocardia inohanensis]|uniref:GIY-YIG nuclease family protein n=1 Tax=Nocardia inohanensis TaxID=209246 RepID=UPI000AEC81DA|nr:GIY-YIG nuclease family protein [Nocardia inohanensis]